MNVCARAWFRSCIIYASNVVEQSFIYELIAASEDWEEAYWETEIKKMTFGDILKEVKRRKIEKLRRFAKDANWLREVRNEVGAHPTYITEYFELRDRDQLIWANRIMFRDIRKLLQFLSPQRRKQLEMAKLTMKDSEGKTIGESESLKDFLSNPTRIGDDVFFDWRTFEAGLLNELAFEAYNRMCKILNGLYYHK